MKKINGPIPAVAEAIAQKNADYIQNLAKTQVEAGAHFIDVCASVDVTVELEIMKWLLAMGAGMASAIINPLHKHMIGLIYSTESLKGNDEYCIEYINGYRKGLYGPIK